MVRNKRVLVTGGGGFIGSKVVEYLQDAGAEVAVLDNGFTGSKSFVSDMAIFKQVDLRDDCITGIVRDLDPDAIVHLAAIHYIPYCNENPEETFRVNVMGTRNVLRAAREVSRLDSFIFASSAAVYPPRDTPNLEDSRLDPMDIYGETKLVGEKLAKEFTQSTGVSVTSLRLFNVFGPNETNAHLLPAILKQVKAGRREIELGNLTPKRDFIYVTDVAECVLAVLREFDGTFRSYNVGTGREHSVREVVEIVGDQLGEEVSIVQDETRTRDSDRPHLCANIDRARAELDWEPSVRFEDGLSRLLRPDCVVRI